MKDWPQDCLHDLTLKHHVSTNNVSLYKSLTISSHLSSVFTTRAEQEDPVNQLSQDVEVIQEQSNGHA